LRNSYAVFGFCVAIAVHVPLHGQPPASQAQQPAGGRGRGAAPPPGRPEVYPSRPPADPASVERGRGLYGVRCAFCHGADTRGGDGGPSLLRSQVVQDDQHGEVIAPIIRGGRPPRMPPFDLTDTQAGDVAAFLHTFQINSRDPARVRPESIVTGDATAGEAYFRATCASCHSPARDLKGIASRFADPRALQQWWLIPGGGGRGRGADPGASAVSPTATVTLPSGQKYEGRLVRIDEFLVSVVEADGTTRSFGRNGETPKVEVRDPLQPHKALLRTYTDKDIHDVTAYLVTLK
jgi:cytochrome c oxidase cbb3-type subunit 3